MNLKNKRFKDVPDSLIKKSIGICKCIEDAVMLKMPLYILKMYAEESDRISKEYDKYN